MTCCVRILSTQSLDSSPAVLLISSDGSKTLVNCGEGCQRIFLEFGQKVSSVNRICLAHLSHDSIGGMPGMILTAADVITASVTSAKAAIKPNGSEPPQQLPGIELIGPLGTAKFIHSLRHFMRRSAFEVRIREGAYFQKKNEKLKKQNLKGREMREESFHVQSIACLREDSHQHGRQKKRPRVEGSTQVLSFVFTTPPILGKFLADKAKSLGIPKGPLYGQLKAGKSVSFQNEKGEEQTVQSSEVVEPGTPGVAIAVLCYPTQGVWEQLSASETLNRFTEKNPKEPFLEVIVHMAPKTIFLSDACRTWRESFGTDVRHIFLHTGTRMDKARVSNLDNGTPFHAAYAGALCRTKLSSLVYGDLTPTFPESMEDATTIEAVSYVEARPLLEYAVLPRIKAGFRNQNAFRENWRKIKSESDELLRVSGSLHLAKEILMDEAPVFANNGGELFFTGTGSAIPCKHRNVSGIYLKMENCNSMLLDVGEGTVGQLLRAKRGESGIIQGIKAVWISHPHADHHLGILRLLTERKYVADDPVVLIAPPNLLNFLKEYETIDPSIGDSYIFMDCRDITPKAQPSNWPKERLASHNSTMQRLRLDLGITSCTAISVAHCPHAYAVVLKGTSFGCLAYSGDCRPSEPFAAAAHDADLLIHEATFEDGMEAEALVKRHCTVGEALRVAKQMKAKTTVLTHFSQRYPRVPPLPTDNQDPDNGCPVIFAYDYMKLTPSNLVAASKITPALRLLYPETEKTVSAEQSAVAALGVPGLFAQKEIL